MRQQTRVTGAIQLRIKKSHVALFTEDAVRSVLDRFGIINRLRMAPPKAFINYSDVSAAVSAVDELNNRARTEFGGHKLFAHHISTHQIDTLALDPAARVPEAVNASSAGIAGLIVVPDLLTEDLEKSLLQEFDQDDLWQEQISSRRTQHFGYAYDYKIQGAEYDRPIGTLPNSIAKLVELMQQTGAISEIPNQATLQEYDPGQGIPPHIDTVWAFGAELASVALLSHTVMRFKPVFTTGVDPETSVDVKFPRRALLVMTGDSRYKWTHSIAARKNDVFDGVVVERSRRLSFTFRRVLQSAAVPK